MEYYLPKWPELRVEGKPVTRKQAMEIIARTDRSVINPSSNDRAWCEAVAQITGAPVYNYTGDTVAYHKFSLARDKFEKSIGYLAELEYLRPSRITDCYIGGSRGWVDWDGHIGTAGHNIGKWPNAEGIKKEWEMILEAFPFLSLRAQLFSGEQCEENCKPVVEYVVGNGNVEMKDPGKEIASIARNDIIFGSERYCSKEQLKEAMALVLPKA